MKGSEKYLGEPKCVLCGAMEELEIHTVPFSKDTITLCRKHHFLYHQMEKPSRRELVREGMDKKARDGWALYKAPMGYRYKDGRLIVKEDEAEIVRKIYREYLKERSTVKVSRKLNLPRKLVYRVLKNEIYLGKVKWKGEVIEGKHPPLIDKEIFERVNELLRK
jgi:site-specific DNA recombinase